MKAKRFLLALHKARPAVPATQRYEPCDVLILYGLGGADRRDIAQAHLNSGKPFIAFDLGYWDRHGAERKFRLSLNSNHPSREVLQGPQPGPERFLAANLPTGDVADPAGPIMLVGNAPKSIAFGAEGWTRQKLAELRAAFPEREIVYRPKPNRPHEPVRYDRISHGPIDQALQGMSLVVCRHSNVAVDACRLGVPVVCDDGAAAAIYPQALSDYEQQPNRATRMAFLHRLAHWQYSASEAELAWRHIEGLL